ncbi:phytanoyl-CoA dioxygenase family protein [Variovorax boronicumulans]|uniref:phytanoyl-CoA dioxygenase family protein n=1 Tax=Variovorax boronicumulans TaxID=436515 RepID=UPI0033975C06
MTGKAFKQSELDFFHREGYLRVTGGHSKARLNPIKESILRELARLGIWAGGKSVGRSVNELLPFQQIAKLASVVKIADLDEALNTPEIRGAIVGLTGMTPQVGQGSQLLLSLPRQGRWSSSNLNWHVDIASKPGDEIPGIQAFYLIDDVAQHAGATLALARSHRLEGEVARMLRGALKTPTDLEAVLSTSNTEVVEMSGRAGDVFLMDMRVLHTPSINASKNIRMMATTRFNLRAAG